MPDAETAAPSVLFDETEDERLSEICAPCFALILQLRASSDFGDADPLRERIIDLLGDVEQEALAAGVPASDLKQVKFALVAFIDETILSSDWRHQGEWMDQPLQAQLYDRYDLGEEFFSRLEEMREDPSAHAEVLEVYYLCMALGFKGRYQLHQQEKLREIIEDTYEELREAPGLAPGPLSPNGTPRGQVATEFKSKLPSWVIVVAAVALGALIYLGMSFYISDVAEDTAEAVQQQITRTEQTR